jgi:hypothetical protein
MIKKKVGTGHVIKLIIAVYFSIYLSVVKAEDIKNSMAKDLNHLILESGSEDGDSTLVGQTPRSSKKLDWFSDVMTERNDLFISQANYDSPADNSGYGRTMLRRAMGRESANLARDSELKSTYESVNELLKDAAEMLTYKRDAGPPLSHDKSKGKRPGGDKVLAFGFDASDQFNPSVKIYDNVKMSYEPFSSRFLTEISWDF